jgi:hypothetical protein
MINELEKLAQAATPGEWDLVEPFAIRSRNDAN